jgi:hypothetical protein
MLKRRLAIVGTAVLLGLTGMAGAALADDEPVRIKAGAVKVHGEPDFVGGRLKCWVSGSGKVVKFSKTKVAELVEERVLEEGEAWELAADGVTVVPADRVVIGVPAGELPRKVVKHRKAGRVIHLTCTWDEFTAR